MVTKEPRPPPHRKNEVGALHLQRVDRVGEDESREDVEIAPALHNPRQRRKNDLARLFLDDFQIA